MTAIPVPKTAIFLPLPYQPSFEQPEKDEKQTIDDLMETLRNIRETTYKDTGHAMRSVHAKSHGLLTGELRVLDNLPSQLAQGLFAKPGTYKAIMRLSSTPGDVLPDSVSTPHGCALKIIDVEGERLPGSEEGTSQDFILVNAGKAFQVKSLKQFLRSLQLLAKTTDKAESGKVAWSAVMRRIEKMLEALGGKSVAIRAMGGEPEKHLLGESYFTQVPLLFGAYMAKLSLEPVSPELKALTGKTLEITKDPLAKRHAVMKFFAQHGGQWELRAQLCTDLETMPIEEASVQWPEEISPYLTVAILNVPPQPAWDRDRSQQIDDHMAFSPWQGLAAHRPIGSIMRARQLTYEASASFRARHQKDGEGGCPFMK